MLHFRGVSIVTRPFVIEHILVVDRFNKIECVWNADVAIKLGWYLSSAVDLRGGVCPLERFWRSSSRVQNSNHPKGDVLLVHYFADIAFLNIQRGGFDPVCISTMVLAVRLFYLR
jgi:hypothetical protein